MSRGFVLLQSPSLRLLIFVSAGGYGARRSRRTTLAAGDSPRPCIALDIPWIGILRGVIFARLVVSLANCPEVPANYLADL